MRPATLVLGSLLAFFAVADFFIYAEHQAIIAASDAFVATCFFTAYFLMKRDVLRAEHANATGGILAAIVTADILHDTWLTQDPTQTTYLMLALIGLASLVLSMPWMAAVTMGMLSGWLVLAASHFDAAWMTMGFSLLAAAVVAFLIQSVRLRTHTRLETTRLSAERATADLAVSEQRYRELVEAAPDAFLVHRDGRVLYANAAAIELFGASDLDDLLQIDSISLVHPDDQATVRERTRSIQHEGKATEGREMRIMRLDGQDVWVEALGQPIDFLGAKADQTIIRDITDRKRAEEDRRKAAMHLAEVTRLKDLDEAKTEFVNAITHELRTPLTPVKLQLHTLKDPRATPERKARALSVLDRNVDRLHKLVNELLEVARIQSGKLRVRREQVDLTVIVAQATEAYADLSSETGVRLTTDLEVGTRVTGDAQRLAQTMDNLLGNAFKFVEPGGHVSVELRAEGTHALVRVSDDGRGIDPEGLKRLFDAFAQAHLPEEGYKGTGLGLYICRHFIEAQDGEIWCESDGLGRGATFAFRLPLDTGEPREAADPEPFETVFEATGHAAAPLPRSPN